MEDGSNPNIKDRIVKNSRRWITFSALQWITFRALQTARAGFDECIAQRA